MILAETLVQNARGPPARALTYETIKNTITTITRVYAWKKRFTQERADDLLHRSCDAEHAAVHHTLHFDVGGACQWAGRTALELKFSA